MLLVLKKTPRAALGRQLLGVGTPSEAEVEVSLSLTRLGFFGDGFLLRFFGHNLNVAFYELNFSLILK